MPPDPNLSARELRLAFAMGGGVSLGTFSGAALSEVLKLALLRGVDADGRRYAADRISVDVFSGASAGAMSLALMLRSLVHQSPEQDVRARARLAREYPGEFPTGDAERDRRLIHAQIVQDVQERVWGADIHLDRLLGRHEQPPRDLKHAGGILDRRAVDEIAAAELSLPSGDVVEGKSGLLGERVLFACALTNLTGILCDARRDLGAEDAGLLALADGLTSRTHRELRVFDLNFATVNTEDITPERHPGRWCRYHKEARRSGEIGSLKDHRTWAKIAATAIAAGAFPVAFEPVVLRRSRYEYGTLWPTELAAVGLEEFPFTYVDGGALNNEPIREAFRLAAFMDGHRPDADGLVDRRVIFVDPRVDTVETSFGVGVHRLFEMQDPNVFGSFDGVDLVRRATVDRLKAHVPALLGFLTNEATLIEGDRVFLTRRRFELRDTIRTFVDGALGNAPPQPLFDGVMDFCEKQLASDAANVMIPPGALKLHTELERVIAEEVRDGSGAFRALAGKARAFVAGQDHAADPHAALWMRALLFVAIDLVLDLEGKHPNSRLIAIAPIANIAQMAAYMEDRLRDGADATSADVPTPEIIHLPGGRVMGFGGFCSREPGPYEMALARQCAREFLEACGMCRRPAAEPPRAQFTAAQERAYHGDLRRGLGMLAERVERMIKDGHLLQVFPGLDGVILGRVAAMIGKKIRALDTANRRSWTFTLRIAVPDKRCELDGAGLGDRDLKPVRRPDGGWELVLCAEWAPGSGWTGPFVDARRQRIAIDQDLTVFPPRMGGSFCSLALPSAALCTRALILPNPTFTAEVTSADRGRHLDHAELWALEYGARSLDETLFGEQTAVRPPPGFRLSSDGLAVPR